MVSEPAIAFAERDWLLVSDFANHTGDPIFDRSLNTALSAALTQSRYVNVVPSSRIRESLRRMEKANLTRTDEATAREIALREGFRLVLAPAVTSTGGTYLLAASLLDPANGATLKSETVHARTKDDVLAAVDELSSKIRGDLGEASGMIAGQAKPLAKATTASLEALQHFSLGREAHIAQQLDKARALYEEALRIDPTFTGARASLGIINFEFFDRAKGIELRRGGPESGRRPHRQRTCQRPRLSRHGRREEPREGGRPLQNVPDAPSGCRVRAQQSRAHLHANATFQGRDRGTAGNDSARPGSLSRLFQLELYLPVRSRRSRFGDRHSPAAARAKRAQRPRLRSARRGLRGAG